MPDDRKSLGWQGESSALGFKILENNFRSRSAKRIGHPVKAEQNYPGSILLPEKKQIAGIKDSF